MMTITDYEEAMCGIECMQEPTVEECCQAIDDWHTVIDLEKGRNPQAVRSARANITKLKQRIGRLRKNPGREKETHIFKEESAS